MPREVRPRYADPKDAGLEVLSERFENHLKGQMTAFLFDRLGLQLDGEQHAPKRSGVIPRIFVLGKNAEGRDFPLDVNDLPYKPDSREFLEQIRLGNVFVYPAGKEKPVQLQIDPPQAPGRPFTLECSDALEPEQVPPPPVKPLTGLQKFLRFISLGFACRKEARDWAQAQKDRADTLEKLRDQEAVSARELEGEIAAFEDEKKHRAEAADLDSAKTELDAPMVGKENFLSVFKPVPEKREDFLKYPQGHLLGKKYAFYRETDFRDLTIFTDDEAAQREKLKKQDAEIEKHTKDKIEKARKNAQQAAPIPQAQPGGKPKALSEETDPDKLAEGKDYQFESFSRDKVIVGGKPLTDAQFSAVGLAACFRPKNVLGNAKIDKEVYDPTLVPALMNCGLTEAEAMLVVGSHERNMGTTDLFLIPPRDSEGNRIHDYVNVGRKEAAEAFRQYQNGSREPLAKLIADGVNTISGEFSTVSGDHFPTQQRGAAVMARELVGLMQQDPTLAELAKKQGMDAMRLENLKGMLKIEELEMQGRRAKHEIARARYERRKLEAPEKTLLAKQMLMSQLTILRLNQHRAAIERDKNSKYNQIMDGIVWIDPPMDRQTGYPLPRNQWPQPPKGQVYNASQMQTAGGVHFVFDPMPAVAEDLNTPQGMQKLETLAETIIRQEGLADLTNDELFEKLGKGKLDLGSCAQKAVETLLQKQEGKDRQLGAPEKAEEIKEAQQEPEVVSAVSRQ